MQTLFSNLLHYFRRKPTEVSRTLIPPLRISKVSSYDEYLDHADKHMEANTEKSVFENGLISVERQYNDRLGESHTYTRTLVTGKGLAFIQKRLSSREEAVG